MDRYDPNQWTQSFVSGNENFCMEVLRDTNSKVIELVHQKNHTAAVAGLDRILNGLTTLQNGTSGNYAPHLCLFSWTEGELILYGEMTLNGITAPEDKRRAMALKCFEDAYDFARTESTKDSLRSIIRDLKSGSSLNALRATYAPDFPSSIIDMLRDLQTKLTVNRSTPSAAAPASRPSGKGCGTFLIVLAILALIGFGIFALFHVQKDAQKAPAPLPNSATMQESTAAAQQETVNSSNTAIVGRWQYINESTYVHGEPHVEAGHWTFYMDGTFETYDMGYMYTAEFGWDGARGSGEASGTYMYDGTQLTLHYAATETIDGYPVEAYTEVWDATLEGNQLKINHTNFSVMLKDGSINDVILLLYGTGPSAPFVGLEGIWIAAAEPTMAEDENHSYFTNAGYYTFTAEGDFKYTQIYMGKMGTWYHVGGGESSYEGTYHYDGITMTLHYTTAFERYYNEELGYEETRPVAIDETEQFPMEINRSCADMCAIIPEHPRLGKLFAFEKCKSDDPIHALCIALNSGF